MDFVYCIMYLLDTLCNIFIFIFYNVCTLYIVQCKYFTKPIVGGDFSENCHFVVQDAAQGYHWANDQVTIHPFIVYHKLVIIVSMTIYLYLKMPSFFNFSLNL